MRSVLLVIAVASLLNACAHQTPVFSEQAGQVSAEEALALAKSGQVKLLDVRSLAERQHREVRGVPVSYIRFGPNVWRRSGTVEEVEEQAFIAEVRKIFPDKTAPLAPFCNAGVRSLAATALLARHGYRVMFITGNYMGTPQGPGLSFFSQ